MTDGQFSRLPMLKPKAKLNSSFEYNNAGNILTLRKGYNKSGNYLISDGQPRKKRGAEERQTAERYTTVRRRCRRLRTCGITSRLDIDITSQSLLAKDATIDRLDHDGQAPDGSSFVSGKCPDQKCSSVKGI